MTTPLYLLHQSPKGKPEHAHAGLWFDRYFNAYQIKGKDWLVPKPENGNDPKRDWINTVKGPAGEQSQLQQFTDRQTALVRHRNGRSERYRADWHFVTGMGNPHPVENGFSWHPTLGVPYLAGSAVKGLVRAWVEGNDEGLPEVEQKARLKRWFGTESKGEVAEQAGGLVFFDAIPDERPFLVCDIMTPHMGDWYSDGEKGDPKNSKAIPADWHEPVPIPFLAVKNIRLVFSIAPRLPQLADELDAVFAALTNALEWLGAGAKTATGYGYMTLDAAFSHDQAEAAKQKARQQAEQQRLAILSPIEQELEIFLKPIQPQEHDTRLLQELEKGRWQGEDIKVVAQQIKALMEHAGKWLPDFAGENKQKLKLKERSQKVLKYLQD